MLYHNNILSLTVADLVKCGVSESYIKKALNQQRNGAVYCWAHHKEGRTVYIHYGTLKNEYKERVKTLLCGGFEPAEFLANLQAAENQQKLCNVFSQIPELLEINPDTLKSLCESGLYTPVDAQRVARAEAWLKLSRQMNVKTARKYGCSSVTEIQTELFKHYLNDQSAGWVLTPKPINNIQVFNRLARKWENEGVNALLHKGLGNQNKKKVDTIIHAKLLELACNPVKYSFEDIGLMYNDFAEANSLQKITVSAIKAHLNQPAIKRVWYYLRHGKQEGDRVYRQQIERDAPSRPDALWSLDGSTMQLYYRTDKGVMCSDLYVVFVSDGYSGAIIGSAVGFVENSGLVIEALNDAIVNKGYKPYQLQYDNGRANVSTVVKSLMSNMTKVNFPCRPYAAAGKYIEGVIGHFQQTVLRKFQNFKGGNVTVRSENSKANPELLKYLKENIHLLPDEAGAIAEFNQAVKDWNARGKRNNYGQFEGASKLDLYNEAHPDRVKLNYFERLSLFMIEVPNNLRRDGMFEYKQQGIEIKIAGQKLHYIVPDNGNTCNDFMFARENLYNAFKIRMNVSIDKPSYISLYDKQGKHIADAYEKQRFASCIADMREGDMSKIKQFIAQADAMGYNNALSELEAQRVILQSAGFYSVSATGTDGMGYGINWSDTPKVLENKRQNTLEDKRNGIFTESTPVLKVLTDLEKRLSRIGS